MFHSPGDVSPGLFRWCRRFERKLRNCAKSDKRPRPPREEIQLIFFLALLANLAALAQQKRNSQQTVTGYSCCRRDRGFAPGAFRNSFGSECRWFPIAQW